MECRADKKQCCCCIENNVEHTQVTARVTDHTDFSKNEKYDLECNACKTSDMRKDCITCRECKTLENNKDENQKMTCPEIKFEFTDVEIHYPSDIACLVTSKLPSKITEVPSKNAVVSVNNGAKLQNGYIHSAGNRKMLSEVSHLARCDSDVDIISGNEYYLERFEGTGDLRDEQMQSFINIRDNTLQDSATTMLSTTRHITRSIQNNPASLLPERADFDDEVDCDAGKSHLKNRWSNSCIAFSGDSFSVNCEVSDEYSALMAREEEALGSGRTDTIVEDYHDQPSLHHLHINQCRDLEETKEKAEVGQFQRDSSETEVKQVLFSDDDRDGEEAALNSNTRRLREDAEICAGPGERNHDVKALLMCRPLSTTCPAGLETLLDASQVVVHMGNLRHDIFFNIRCEKRMEVIDETRRMMYYVEQEPMLLSNRNSFLFKLYDRSKQEVMQIYNPASRTCLACGIDWHWFKTCHLQAVVYSPLGVVSGFIKRAQTCLVQEFHILAPNEALLLRLRGSARDLEIYSVDLQHGLGRLTVHGWIGVMHEVRRTSHDYGLTFPLDMDVRVKSLLLASVFVIDWLYSSDIRQRR